MASRFKLKDRYMITHCCCSILIDKCVFVLVLKFSRSTRRFTLETKSRLVNFLYIPVTNISAKIAHTQYVHNFEYLLVDRGWYAAALPGWGQCSHAGT